MNSRSLSTESGSLRANVLWLISSTGAGHVISFVSAPLLIALYAPVSFGEFALLSAAATMIGSVSATRFERAIVLTSSDDDARLLLRICLALNVLTGLAVLAGLFVGRAHFEFLAGRSSALLFMTAALTATFGASQTVTHWLMRRGQFSRLAFADLCVTLATLALQATLGLWGHATAESLLCGVLAGRVVSIALMFSAAGSLALGQQRRLADVRRLLVEYRTLALYSTPNAIVATLQFRVLLFVVAHFGGVADAGRLAIAYRLTYVPATAFGMALRRVFFPVFSRGLFDRGTNESALTMLAVLGVVVPPSVLAGALLFSAAGGLLPVEWREAIAYVNCLLPVAAVLMFTSWFDQVYDVLHLQRLALLFESGASLIAVGLFYAVAAVGAPTTSALAAYAAWIFVYNVAWLSFTWQLARWPHGQLFRAVVAGGVYSLALCLALVVAPLSLLAACVLLVAGAFAAWQKLSTVMLWIGKDDDIAYQKVA